MILHIHGQVDCDRDIDPAAPGVELQEPAQDDHRSPAEASAGMRRLPRHTLIGADLLSGKTMALDRFIGAT
jgi:hypothetical protein